MSKVTYEQLRGMVGRKFVRDIHPGEPQVEIRAVGRANNGFSVVFRLWDASGDFFVGYSSLGLREFPRRYPHMIED